MRKLITRVSRAISNGSLAPAGTAAASRSIARPLALLLLVQVKRTRGSISNVFTREKRIKTRPSVLFLLLFPRRSGAAANLTINRSLQLFGNYIRPLIG